MVDRELVDFISANLKRGMSYDEVQSQLLARGYSDFEISQAREAMMSGQRLEPVNNAPDRKIDAKWFFYTLGVIIFVVFMFIIFGIIFSNVKPTSYSLTEDSIYAGTAINVSKNSLIEIESFRGTSLSLDLFATSESLALSGSLGEVSIPRGSNMLFDVDDDGSSDLKITYFYEGEDRVVSIVGVCQEDWQCTDWSECVLGKRFRDCNDVNSCGTNLSKPILIETCESSDLENYTVTGVKETVVNKTVNETSRNETNSSTA